MCGLYATANDVVTGRSKRAGRLEEKFFAGDRMRELERLRVEVKPWPAKAIQGVTHDGATQAQLVRSVDAELMGATAVRKKRNTRLGLRVAEDFPRGDGWLAVLGIVNLSGTIVDVDAKR